MFVYGGALAIEGYYVDECDFQYHHIKAVYENKETQFYRDGRVCGQRRGVNSLIQFLYQLKLQSEHEAMKAEAIDGGTEERRNDSGPWEGNTEGAVQEDGGQEIHESVLS